MASRSVVLFWLLASSLAWGQEVSPVHMYQAGNPEPIGYPNWVLTPEGKERIGAAIADMWTQNAQLRTERDALQQKTLELAGKPELTWKGVLVLVGVGLVLGVTGGVVLGKRL
jgi:hypothetical protein